jgi:hypothetical protein
VHAARARLVERVQQEAVAQAWVQAQACRHTDVACRLLQQVAVLPALEPQAQA